MLFKSVITFVFIYYELISWCGATDSKEDAKLIFEAQDRNKALLDIIPNRGYDKYPEINAEFANLNGGVPLVGEKFFYLGESWDDSLSRLLFTIIYGARRTVAGYMNETLFRTSGYRSNKIITEILVLGDSYKKELIDDYKSDYPISLQDAIEKNTGGDFRNFLKEMIGTFRLGEDCDPGDNVDAAVDRLNAERQKDGSWGDNRNELDSIFIEKPIPFVLEVIDKYASSNGGNKLIDDLRKKLKGELEFGYTSLVDYIQDRYRYIAHRIHDCVEDDFDNDATLILTILCYMDRGDVFMVNQAFMDEYEGKQIEEFLLEGENPGITRQILAAMIALLDET